MAKQVGINPIVGKVGQQVYYVSKSGGAQSRSAYIGQSARVKTAPEYANLRRCGKEFGMCGKFAASILRPFVQRWRYMVGDNAQGKLTAYFFKALQRDTESEWGKRSLSRDEDRAWIPRLLSELSKNPPPMSFISEFDGLPDTSSITPIRENGKFRLQFDATSIYNEVELSELKSLGVDRIRFSGGYFYTSYPAPIGGSNTNFATGYDFYIPKCVELFTSGYDLTHNSVVETNQSMIVDEFDVIPETSEDCCFFFFYCIPYKNEQPIQEKCWFYAWSPIVIY